MEIDSKVVNSHADVFDAVAAGLRMAGVDYTTEAKFIGAGSGVFTQDYIFREHQFEVEAEVLRTKLMVESKFPGGPTVSFRPKFEVVTCINGMVGNRISGAALALTMNRTPMDVLAKYAQGEARQITREFVETFALRAYESMKQVILDAKEMVRDRLNPRVLGIQRDTTCLREVYNQVIGEMRKNTRWDVAMALSAIANRYDRTDVPLQVALQRLAYGFVVLESKSVVPIPVAH